MVLILAILSSVLGNAFCAYSYCGLTGPAKWGETGVGGAGTVCGSGSKQSPVDLTGATYLSSLVDFSINTGSSYTLSLDNTGHTVEVTVSGGTTPTVSGGNLGATYNLQQFHFHWGAADTQGSEHTLDGTKYPMEIHYVFYKSTYADFSTAVASGASDALAVFGFWVTVESTGNTVLEAIADALTHVQLENAASHSLASQNIGLGGLLPSALTGGYFRYSGSLTTPPCNEIVTWTVFRDTIPITSAKLALFRGIYEGTLATAGTEIVDNYRPVQPPGSRTLYTSISSSGNVIVDSVGLTLMAAVFSISA